MWLILAAVLWFVFYSCLFVSGRESRKEEELERRRRFNRTASR